MSTCAHTGDDGVNATGKVSQYFLGGGAYMHLNVGGVVKLLRHPCARGGYGQFMCAGNGAFHAFLAGG